MKTSKLIAAVATLMAFWVVNSFVVEVSAQQPIKLPKCRTAADQIYYVDSGQSVTEVHPGSNGGNGYQLNILGTNVNKFYLVKEPYMKSVLLVFANDTQAKWQIYFEPKMGRVLSSVSMRSDCTGKAVIEYPLTESIRLLDQ